MDRHLRRRTEPLRDNRLTSYTVKDGLYNNGVFQILEDDASTFWMTSNRGIHRVAKEQLNAFAAGTLTAVSSSSYGKSDGMRSEECNGGNLAGRRSRQRRDAVVADPGRRRGDRSEGSRHDLARAVVKIESVAIDGATVPRPASPFGLLPGQENLEIRYTGLTFVNAERMVFRYQLHGVDRGWVYAGTRRLAHYAHVPPGRYTFSVLAANSDGVWATTPATTEVVVMPPYWRTAGFIGSVSVGTILLAGFAYRRHWRPCGATRSASRSSPAS